jgi:hypothetical protein
MTTAVRFEVSKASPWLGAEAGVDLTAQPVEASAAR